MTGAPPPRRPYLPATFRGVAAVWLYRRLSDRVDLASAPGDLARIAGPEAGRELAQSLAELAEAARQWTERERSTAAGTTEHPPPGDAPRSPHELTTQQAAHALGVTPSLVRRYARSGRLPARRLGGSWLLERGPVLDLRDARARGGAA